MSCKYSRNLAFFVFGCLAVATSFAQAVAPYSDEYKYARGAPTLKIGISGAQQVVNSGSAFHCPGLDIVNRRIDIPDAPLRVVRAKNGLLAVAPHYNNLAYSSRDLSTLERRNCRSLLESKKNGDPSAFADHEWLVSPYMYDGQIFSLVHVEYWGALYDAQCKRRLGRGVPWSAVCLYVNLTGAVSDDGLEFTRLGLLAAYPYAFAPDMNRNGVRDPSNLFKNPMDGYVYFMAWADAYREQIGGQCIFRSKNPIAGPWEAWDGKQFAVHMSSPYTNKKNAVPSLCTPVSGVPFTTVLYHEPSKSFVGLAFYEHIKPGGIFYRTSPDLIHWSKPELLMEAHSLDYWKTNGDKNPVLYPSMIDPSSSSPNFDTMQDNPYLYFFEIRVKNGEALSRERDIVRVPLSIRKINKGD